MVKVMVFAGLGTFSACLPKLREMGLSATGTTPVPDNATLCGLFAALSAIVRAAVSAPVWLGVNVTEMVHLTPGAMLAGQLFVSAKSLVLVPVNVIPEMFRFVVPLLVSVTVFAVLAVPNT